MTNAVLLRLKLKPTKAQSLIRLLPRARKALNGSGVTATILRRIFTRVLKIEGLYTESVFLEQADDGDYVLWYMEAEDMDHFQKDIETIFESDRLLGIVVEKVIRSFIEEPEKALNPGDNEKFELFVHGINPDRP